MRWRRDIIQHNCEAYFAQNADCGGHAFLSSVTTAQTLSVAVAVSGRTGNPAPTGSVILVSCSYTSAGIS
jgi:hypothetical protein